MNAAALAKALWPHVGAKDPKTGDDDPVPTAALKNYAAGYIAMLQAGVVAHALPGSVKASAAPPASPVQGGSASGGKLLALLPPVMVAKASQGALPTALPGLTLECSAIAAYLMANAKVAFDTGTIKGNSTAVAPPPGAPGPLVAGSGSGGKISGLSGGPLAKKVTAATLQKGPKQVEFYTELVNYTMKNASVTYPPNTVVGTCTPAGQLTLGLASGGAVA